VDKARSIPYLLTTNRQSWVEDYDVSVAKPPDTYRIFYVGDSTVQGTVAAEYKMVEIVEKKLNERSADSGIHFEVINTGTSSYSILTYYLLVKTDLLEYSPDLVVLNIDMTDVVQDYTYRQWIVKNNNVDISGITNNDDGTPYIMTPQGVVRGHKRTRAFMWLVRHSATAYYFDRALLMQQAKKIASSQQKGDETANWLALEWTESIMENVNLSMQTLASTIKLLKSKGIKVMLTGVPHLPQYEGKWSVRPFQMLENVAKENDIPYLNSYEEMRKKAENKNLSAFYWETDPTHFNIKGNQKWAEIQFDFLTDKNNNLLPFDRLAPKTPASR
jgi:lysophospholipase L1-like esterase